MKRSSFHARAACAAALAVAGSTAVAAQAAGTGIGDVLGAPPATVTVSSGASKPAAGRADKNAAAPRTDAGKRR